jgi:hypothetical protein
MEEKEKSRSFLQPWLCFAVIVAFTLFAGCSSSDRASEDSAPADIRGEPIQQPKPDPNSSVAVAGGSSSTNSVQVESGALVKNELTLSDAPTILDPKANADDPPAPAANADGFIPLAFDKLASFTFEVPDDRPSTNQPASSAKSEDQIPRSVKVFHEKRVALKGFMLPLRVESGLVTEMLLMRDQSMCCYGTVPKITEWVSVKMTNKGVKAIMDQPVTIFGKLRVGEMRENGYLVGIYALDGEKMGGPPDL